MNNAPVAGFERDAGSHTTVRLMYPEGAPRSTNEYQDTTMVALVVFKSLDLDWLTSVVTKQPLVSPSHRGDISLSNPAITVAVLRASGPNCGSGGRWWMIFL